MEALGNFSLGHVEGWARSGGTQRFHTHAARMIRTQDVAQHSYNVVGLVIALTGGAASRSLILAALLHDAGEHWTGDVPAPTKRRDPTFRAVLDAAELAAVRAQLGMAEAALSVGEAAVLKLSDSLEGALHCAREIELGNRLVYDMMANFLDYVAEVASANVAPLRADEALGFDWRLFNHLDTYLRRLHDSAASE